MGYQNSGIEEFLRNGQLVSIPTCIYGERMEDAVAFDDEFKARSLAALLGADLMVVGKRAGARAVK